MTSQNTSADQSHRQLTAATIVVASHNPGKVREIGALLAPYGLRVQSAAALDLIEPKETGETYVDNALIKARYVAMMSELPALADDSGLSVTALGGAPGVRSARWAGPDKDFAVAMERVNAELGDVPDRSAAFHCALALVWPEDEHEEVFEGKVNGTLTWPPRGDQGFGYDPIFVPDGYDITFGEMDPERKHAMSHRAAAFAKLTAACFPPPPKSIG